MDLPKFLLDPLLALAWLILLGAPVAGFWLRQRWHPSRDAILLVLMFTALIPALVLSGISTASQTLNLTFAFMAYAGYCVLAPYSLAIPGRVMRITVTFAAYLPIAAVYLFATIGALASLFLLAQSYPTSRQTMRPGLVCEIHEWGVPGATRAGYDVNLYRTWALAPWVRLQAYSAIVTVPPGAVGPWPGCAEILQKYDHRH
jgi:hypothetical protein